MTIPHQGSLSSVQRKEINQNLAKQLKKWAKAKVLKQISDQEVKESMLENNPVPRNFLFRQKLDDYLLEILSEAGKKDEIFSDRSLMKEQENLTNIMGPLGRLWVHLDHLKKDNEGVIDLIKLLELVKQCAILVGQYHSRGSCFRRQIVQIALFKDRCKVKSLLKEGAHCLKRNRRSFSGKSFKKRVKKLFLLVTL